MAWGPLSLAAVVSAVALAGFFVGRYASRGMVRARELEAELEDLRKEHEIGLAELEAARHEWKRTQNELDDYRANVVDHFSGTSSLLRDLTHRYRAVYDHLKAGAQVLCPEGSLRVEGAAEEPDVLPPGGEPAAARSDEEPARLRSIR